ncbi:MAG: hypothetical protein BIFFINMI_03738 [Phycisphaerae bacterium]|nr:hypothetical protein [Phycisphaerae bacterium]
MRNLATVLCALAMLTALEAAPAAGEELAVKVSANSARFMPYQVFELTFQHVNGYKDPTWDVAIELKLTAPSGKAVTVGGFFYGSSRPQKPTLKTVTGNKGREQTVAIWPCDPADLWKARFAPAELGEWKYAWTFRDVAGGSAAGQGSFAVVRGRGPARHGFLRVNPDNPRRLIFDDGSAYWPIGWQDGLGDANHNGTVMDSHGMEGPFRLDSQATRPKVPPGALFARGPNMGPVSGDAWLGRHARAGFNMWRFSPNNATQIKLFATPGGGNSRERVLWEEAAMIDEMLRRMHDYDVRTFYGLFGYMDVCAQAAKDAKDKQGRPMAGELEKVKRLIKYSVDRWGAYVDVWELLNEQKADPAWYEIMAPYLRSVDPYRHPISTSWEHPELDCIDINSPHWYQNENELDSDQVTAGRIRGAAKFAKPIIYGEQGNNRGRPDLADKGIGGVWDPGSARRMRVRLWTAMFQEAAFIFWETSYAKDGHFMNLWIGPEERQYVHALQDFCGLIDAGVRPVPARTGGPQAGDVRAYGLASGKCVAVYVHHVRCDQCRKLRDAGDGQVKHQWDHDRGQVRGLTVTVDAPAGASGFWYDPSNGAILARVPAAAAAGQVTLEAPAFIVDLALLIGPGGLPDSDRDGQANDLDPDDDNDGVPDARDAFPLEREEWADADGDRIGDNQDADIDGDGVADDRNRNGVADNQEADWDGDGVPNAGAIPSDAFPRDPKEWRDTDGDGIGDNADPDDDNDGWTDVEEKVAGTDPLNPVSFPAE